MDRLSSCFEIHYSITGISAVIRAHLNTFTDAYPI